MFASTLFSLQPQFRSKRKTPYYYVVNIINIMIERILSMKVKLIYGNLYLANHFTEINAMVFHLDYKTKLYPQDRLLQSSQYKIVDPRRFKPPVQTMFSWTTIFPASMLKKQT